MQKRLAPEHDGELLGDALPGLLDGGGVANKGGGHLEPLGGDVTDGGLDIVGDPLDKVRGVLVDDVDHLLVDLLGTHATTEQNGASQVTSVTRVGGTHHILGIKALLGELGHGECTVLLTSTACQWSVSNHEEVETREWNHVHCKLTKIAVELSRETKTARSSTDGSSDQVIQITICGSGELESTEANIVKSFIIQRKALISILHKLVHRKSSIVRLNNCVRNLW